MATVWTLTRASARDWYIVNLTDLLISAWTPTLISEMTGGSPTVWS